MNTAASVSPDSAALAADPARAASELAALHDLLARGYPAEAEPGFRRLLAAFPNAPIVVLGLAATLQSRGEIGEAVGVLRASLQQNPGYAELHHQLGTLLLTGGDTVGAEAALRRALELAPRHAEAAYNLGVALEHAGRSGDALSTYRKAVDIQPTHARALTRLGALLLQSGQPGDALNPLEQACRAAPQLFDAHYYRGWALAELRRHQPAVRALDRAVELQPQRAEALQARANALREAGRADAALDDYWRLIEMHPAHAPLHADYNQLAWTAGRSDLYLKSFAYAHERLGAQPDLLHLHAAFLQRNRDYARAQRLLEEARRLAPERGDIAGLLARVLAAQGRHADSHPLFAEAIGREPQAMIHRVELGFSLLRDRQLRPALEVFEQALALAPFDQLLLAGALLCYRELGDARYARLMNCERYVRIYDLQAPLGYRDSAAFNAALAEELDRLHTARAEPVDQTVRGGTQTTGALFERPSRTVEQVRERIDHAVQDYIAQMVSQPWHPAELRRTAQYGYAGSWSCRLASGGFHDNHVHPQGWISSAYYARLPKGIGDEARRAGWLKFGESNLALGEQDRAEHHVQPRVGRLVLFPSFFWHGTVPFADSGDRLSVAFDVAPR